MRKHAVQIMVRCVVVVFSGLLVFSCAGERGKPIEKGVIQSDATWSNEILIKGDVEVAPGVTLTIMPGTIVRFVRIEDDGPENLYKESTDHFSRAELIIRGTLIARGTKDRMIVFTSNESSPRAGDWSAVNFLDSKDNVVEYCEISYADTGVHGHGVQVTVKNNYLHDNGVAVAYNNLPKFKTRCLVDVHNNRIVANGGGILCGRETQSRIGHNRIAHNKLYGIFGKKAFASHVRFNDISGNAKGILLHASTGFRLNQNNIVDNEAYSVSLLEGQTYNVDARGNWWGTTDKEEIRKGIWDKDEERGLGSVDFSDFAHSPINGAGLAG